MWKLLFSVCVFVCVCVGGDRLSRIGGGGMGCTPPILQSFSKTPHGVHPLLKNEAPPSEKQTSPLKHEAPFHDWFLEKAQ